MQMANISDWVKLTDLRRCSQTRPPHPTIQIYRLAIAMIEVAKNLTSSNLIDEP
jgi:hypothetical protein